MAPTRNGSSASTLLESRAGPFDELTDARRIVELVVGLKERNDFCDGQLRQTGARRICQIQAVGLQNENVQRFSVKTPDFGNAELRVDFEAIERAAGDVDFDRQVRRVRAIMPKLPAGCLFESGVRRFIAALYLSEFGRQPSTKRPGRNVVATCAAQEQSRARRRLSPARGFAEKRCLEPCVLCFAMPASTIGRVPDTFFRQSSRQARFL